ncbi:phage tail tape measure protein [Herbaspirillum sp. NPDC101397]|uniref:phage tail tape measure protein n=1 Tax=Herbaspirillum sp. NPDC101397 TaxID=3364006 RepID=UPI00383A6EEF
MSEGNLIGSVTIAVETDKEQFRADMVDQAQAVAQFASDATQSSSKAAAALTTVSDVATESTQQMTAAQQRFIDGLQRQVAAIQGGKVASIELKAAQLGVSDSAAPLLAKWRELEAAQRGSAGASDAAAAAMATVAESEAGATDRIRTMVAASLEKTAALKAQQAASLAAATAERELNRGTSTGSSINFAAQNKSLQETADLVNEVNAALASIGRGASGQKELQAQTDKLVSLWGQGRLSAGQYATALKQLDTTELSLVKSSAQATAAADQFIAKLKEQAATAGMSATQLLEYRAAQLGVSGDAAPFIQQIEAGEKAMHGFSLETGGARRELAVIGRELARGDLGAAGRSFSIFAERSGLMTTLLSPAALSIAAFTAALGSLAVAYLQGHDEQERFNASLILAGNYAGTTAEGLHAIAVQATSMGGSLSAAKESVADLASAGRFSSEQISYISSAAVAMNDVTGEAVRDTIKDFEDLGKSPVDASVKLNEQYHYLTQAVYDQIAALERQGDTHAAAELAERTYADALEKRAGEIRASIGIIERAWKGAKQEAASFWDTVMGIGRTKSFSEQIAVAQNQLTSMIQTAGNVPSDSRAAKEIAMKRAEISALQAQAQAADISAKRQRDDAESSEASIAAGRAIDQQSESIDKNIRKRTELLKLSERFTSMMRDANRTGLRNERLDDVYFSETGAPTGGGLYDQLRKDIEEKYKPKAAQRGNDNGLNAQIKAIQGAYQEQERALKLSIQGNKSQYDIGLLDTEGYLKADYEARRAALTNEMALAKQQEEVASKKKNATGLEEAKNLQKKIRDEDLANEEKYVNDLKSLHEKSRRDVAAYVESLNASYRTRQEAINNLIAGAGLGDAAREELTRLNQVQQEFDRAADALRKSREKGVAHGGIDEGQYQQEMAALRDNLEQRLDQERQYSDSLKKVQENGWNGATRFVQNYGAAAANVASQIETVFGTAARGMEDAFATFATTGKLSFSDLAKAVIADIARMQARAAISGLFNFAVGALGSYFGGGSGAAATGAESSAGSTANYFQQQAGGGLGLKMNAKGDVYSSPSLSEYSNSILNKPTFFAFAKGAGVAGEAGPEAIMPLTRSADGNLGVRAIGGNNTSAPAPIQVSVQVNTDGSSNVSAPDDYQQFGRDLADFVDQRINKKLSRAQKDGGALSKASMGYA